MNDFDYDCYIKKSIARSATKRKCGSKSKKCSLPSDNMSQKQWNERCGSVMSCNLGKPMVWVEFNKLPNDLKEEYLNSLIAKYSVNARNIADMFGVSVATIFRVVKKEGLNVKFQKGRHPSGASAEDFKRFLNPVEEVRNEAVRDEAVCEDVSAQNVEAVQAESCVEVPAEVTTAEVNEMLLDKFTLNFSGHINVNMIANSLRYIIGDGREATIEIVCNLN